MISEDYADFPEELKTFLSPIFRSVNSSRLFLHFHGLYEDQSVHQQGAAQRLGRLASCCNSEEENFAHHVNACEYVMRGAIGASVVGKVNSDTLPHTTNVNTSHLVSL